MVAESLEVLTIVHTASLRLCAAGHAQWISEHQRRRAHALLMVLGRLRAVHSASRPSWQVWFHSVWFQALIEYEIIGGAEGVVRAGS